jgi:2-polyprenyl-3-methyl-5-hydroxy-6-metoxy-1,4-benzoquinol methylase
MLLVVSCKSADDKPSPPSTTPAPPAAPAPKVNANAGGTPILPNLPAAPVATEPAAELAAAQEEYVADIMAFTNQTHDAVRERMKKGSVPLKEEWEAWEKQGPMTAERSKAFYKQTANYIYELGEWHFFVDNKRASDLQLVKDVVEMKPNNVLDFGGGVGINAVMLARAGLDVTLADLAGTSLEFAQFRAKKHDVALKLWQTDIAPMPPDAKYDVILALDVLEHLPADVLEDAVNKLVKLKHAGTKVLMSAPFGRTSVHPMHLDADEHTRKQVDRLKNELPPS